MSSLSNWCWRSHDFKLVFDIDIQTTFSKADRLIYGESAMTHAMVFTAVSVDVSSTIGSNYIYTFNLIYISLPLRKTAWPTSCAWRTHGARIVARRDIWLCAPIGSGSLASRLLWTRNMCPRMCCAYSIWIPLYCPPGIPWARWRNRMSLAKMEKLYKERLTITITTS